MNITIGSFIPKFPVPQNPLPYSTAFIDRFLLIGYEIQAKTFKRFRVPKIDAQTYERCLVDQWAEFGLEKQGKRWDGFEKPKKQL